MHLYAEVLEYEIADFALSGGAFSSLCFSHSFLLAIYFDKPSREHWLHIIEEAADVHIMIEQFKMLIKPEDKKEFDKICLEKVNREIGRIEKAGGAK